MAELRSAIFWVLCPKQSLHCYTTKHNKTIAGIRTSVLQGGVVRCGDQIWLE